MAYLDPLGGGKFKVRWREGGRGSPLLASPVFDSEPEAQDFANDIDAKLAARKVLSRSKRTGIALPIGEVAHRWAASRLAERKISADRAELVPRLLLELATERSWRTVADITPGEVDRWRVDNGGRNARFGADLRSVLRWATERLQQPVPDGTWLALRPPRTRRRAREALPERADIKRYQQAADSLTPSASALVHCLRTYGWRPITAARMLIGDVDPKRPGIKLRSLKGTGDDLVHPILPETMKRLRPLIAGRGPSEPLFIDPRTGNGWLAPTKRCPKGNRTAISQWWRAHVDGERGRGVYGLKRHSISSMLAAGLPPQDVQTFTGHQSLSQVLVYARTNDERQDAALAIIGKGERQARKPRRAIAPREHKVPFRATRRTTRSA